MSLNIASPSELVKTVGFAHTAATTVRVPIAIGGKLLIPLNTAAANEHNAYAYETEVDNAPAETGVAWGVNDALYWDAAGGVLTKTAEGNALFGHALQPKAAAAAVSPLVAFDAYTTA
ncbi:DUF2190 family protein [Stenotrophomonas sp. MMGLT7]|uniref:DUF2190 family protein n=1 Tax=Stenotrophomonas sp. MMGLT7 TaxID=2901227 RepID=UPI001E34C11C|nr:DUF2190 family protein [Stenotrophomonas sp. MMGLT7]MCD7096942.1 DUF2190 family protein [Stenotrophomonas sp. MMGLT7]